MEVNGNEENIAIFFIDALLCFQRIVRETESLGHDTVILDRLISELGQSLSSSPLTSSLKRVTIREALVPWRYSMHVFNMSSIPIKTQGQWEGTC